MTHFRLFLTLARRENLIFWRHPKIVIQSSLFLSMIMVFFPLGITPDPALLQKISPSLIWLAVLLACLLASERLFAQEFEEGVLEQWIMSGFSLPVIMVAKISMHWLALMVSFILLCPLIALLFHYSFCFKCFVNALLLTSILKESFCFRTDFNKDSFSLASFFIS